MDVTHEPVEAAPEPRRRSSWTADNPLVRAVGRVPLPLGAKLVIGFGLVAALLAVGYALGLVALGQSNSRSAQLQRLQEQAVYEQLLLTDANQLKQAIDSRLALASSTTKFGSGLDTTIANEMNQLCNDAGSRPLAQETQDRSGGCLGPSAPPPLKLRLGKIDPGLLRFLGSHVALFYPIAGVGQNCAFSVGSCKSSPVGSAIPTLRGADNFAGSFAAKIGALAAKTRGRTDALVAADQSSFADSRDLLIGVGAGSLVLALALGLLLAWSVVAPLRLTDERLAEIGAGDFSGRLEVANRDEIGTLALRVNRTSDELQRVYRELETASRHKSDFLATMSHELRTPLNAIIGFSEVLHEQMFGELNERQLAYVDDVLEAGKHLLSLINDVLDLAKIEAGRMELELTQVAVPEVLRNAVSMLSERASHGGIDLSLQTTPAEITITADERRLRQIVFNLLSNAVKFTPADGRIDVSARLDDHHVEIAVADTGPGIAAEDLETIFEEFEQTSQGKQAEGTGLGLPLSRKLAELHGGRLWAESTPGHGSTFHFTLPVRQEES